jgi:hypothetical protein
MNSTLNGGMLPLSSLAHGQAAIPHSGTGGISSEYLKAADATAWFMLGLLFFCLGCFALSAWVLYRRSQKAGPLPPRDPLSSDSKVSSTYSKPEEPNPSQPWEKEGDWWKK